MQEMPKGRKPLRHMAGYAVQLEAVQRRSLKESSAAATFERNVFGGASLEHPVECRDSKSDTHEEQLQSPQFGLLALLHRSVSPPPPPAALFSSPGHPLPSPARMRSDYLEAAMPRGPLAVPPRRASVNGAVFAAIEHSCRAGGSVEPPPGGGLSGEVEGEATPELPVPLGPAVSLPAGVLWFPTGLRFSDLKDAVDHPPEYAYTATGARRRVRPAEARPLLGRRVTVNDRDVAVFRYKGSILAFDADCPHAGGALELGDIEEYNGSTCVCCPRHGFLFDVRPLPSKFRSESACSKVVEAGAQGRARAPSSGCDAGAPNSAARTSVGLFWKGLSVSPPETFGIGIHPTGVHRCDGTIYVGFCGLSPSVFSGDVDF